MALNTVRTKSVRSLTDSVIELTLESAEGVPLPECAPGAHIELTLPSGLRRQYSIVEMSADRASCTIAVLREENGRGGSQELHEIAREGLELPVEAIRNNFALEEARAYCFIAGGIGVTPLIPMVREADRRGVPWTLHYGARSRGHMAYADEIVAEFGTDRVTLVPEDEAGMMDIASIVPASAPEAIVYCCGPNGLIMAVEEATRQNHRAFRSERFSAEGVVQDVSADGSFLIELHSTGEVLEVPPDVSILDVVLTVRPDHPWSCEEGFCGTCETGVLEGEPEHRGLIECEGNGMLICVGRSRSPRLVLDL
ncbi:PDR/VanB family oxidoreductase [Microbacterium sp. X-17]|uniref:PDR/VanB family oxidoreductase n=1 Tax=Microbacterium sp. X-17 TaxID=3144404 RepID=UPI0031F48B92